MENINIAIESFGVGEALVDNHLLKLIEQDKFIPVGSMSESFFVSGKIKREVFANAGYTHIFGSEDEPRLCYKPGSIIRMSWYDDNLNVISTYSDEKHWIELKKIIEPYVVPLCEDEVKVSFWYKSIHGPASTEKRINGDQFDEIINNYSAKYTDTLKGIVDRSVKFNGKLIILHGPPGTGKTYFIRSLMRGWKDSHSLHYVTDPEEFFRTINYPMSVIPYEGKALIVMEDVDEYICAEAKAEVGQGLARLLNLLDGLLGQGLDATFLFTTNEKVNKFHSALIRAGRCAYNIHLPYLSEEEAKAWCEAHNVELPNKTETGKVGIRQQADVMSYSLADLYDLL